jgi:hypothetical protein
MLSTMHHLADSRWYRLMDRHMFGYCVCVLYIGEWKCGEVVRERFTSTCCKVVISALGLFQCT